MNEAEAIETAALAMAGEKSWDGYDEAVPNWYRERARRAVAALRAQGYDVGKPEVIVDDWIPGDGTMYQS